MYFFSNVQFNHITLRELLNTRMENLDVEGFDDNVTITEMINMLCYNPCRLFLHKFSYFFFCKTIYSKYLNNFKLHHLYMGVHL